VQQMNAAGPHRSNAMAKGQQDAPRRDPAPSRFAYKVHRLWLTPFFRSVLRVGLPAFAMILLAGWYFSDAKNRTALNENLAEMKRAVQERPEFTVKLMAIDGASPGVSDAVREILPVDFPISSFDLDLEAMRREVSKLDVIETAELHIRPGGVLEVSVTERKPAIMWHHDGILDLLDRTGHRVASLTDRTARADLRLIAGDGADEAVPEALALIKAARPLGNDLRGLVRVGERRWDIVLNSNQRILLPAENPVTALEQVIALDQAQELLARDLIAIDMRPPLRPTLRLAEPAVEELRRIKGQDTGDVLQ